MKILIIGKGFIGERLGYFLSKAPNFEVHTLSRTVCDYTNPAELAGFLKFHQFEPTGQFNKIIICAGFTGKPSIDACEVTGTKPDVFFANVTLPNLIIDVASDFGISCINIGSGCVYDGYDKVYNENDEPNWGLYQDKSSFYSKTKHLCELTTASKSHIFRIRLPYTFVSSPKNYFDKILSYKDTLSLPNSMTSVDDLYNFIYNFILTETTNPIPFGVFNVVNPDPITAEEVVEIMKSVGIEQALKKDWNFIKTQDNLGVKALRCNCLLSTELINNIGLQLPDTKQSIRKSLEMYKQFLIDNAPTDPVI